MDDERFLRAKKVYLEKKFEEANSLFSEIIAYSNNYMAIIYKGFNKAYQTTLTDPHHVDMVTAIKEGYDVVRRGSLPENYINNNLEIISEIDKFTMFSLQMYIDKYTYEYNEYKNKKKQTNDYNKYSGDQSNVDYVEKKLNEIEENYKKAQNDYLAGISLSAVAYATSMEIVLDDVLTTKEEIYSLDNYISLTSITKSIYSKFKDSKLGEPLLSKVKKLYDFCNDKVNYLQTGKKEEYWASHKEEKEELESKIKQAKDDISSKEQEIEKLNKDKSELTLDLSTSPSYIKQQEFIKKLDEVNKKLDKVSILDLKKKKELNEEKNKLVDIIRRLGNNVKSERDEVEDKFKNEKKAIDDKINQLQNDIVNLKREIDSNEKLLNQNR